MNQDEVFEVIINDKLPPPEEVTIITADGAIISIDSIKSLHQTDQYFDDFYLNADHKIVEVVIRKKTKEDEQLLQKINKEN